MAGHFDYDSTQDPPAPVLPVRVSCPGSARSILLAALVDTGAEITAIPDGIVEALGLPAIGALSVCGLGGVKERATLHAASISSVVGEEIVEVVAVGSEAILGRDLLKQWVLTLDGPRRRLRVSA